MKRALNSGSRPSTLDSRLSTVLLAAFLIASGISASAVTEGNPYTTIVGRNTFALKPPPPPAPLTPNTPPPQPANITLQGISTILGRPQVLLKVKVPAKPPEPPKELSLVMDVGQREGDVEITEIDASAGIVKINNAGNVLSLNMKDNADKPTVGAAPPAAPAPQPQPGIPGLPQPAAPANAGVSVTTVGGAAGSTVPTRPIRSTPAIGTAAPQTTQPANDLSPEAGAIMLEVNRKLNPGLPYPPSRVKLE